MSFVANHRETVLPIANDPTLVDMKPDKNVKMLRLWLDRVAHAGYARVDGFFASLRAWHQAGNAELHPDAVLYREAKIINLRDRGSIRLGAGTCSRAELLTFAHGGEIIVGDHCYLGAGTRIWSAARVSIGDRVLIAHEVDIHDCNAHPIDARRRHEHFVSIVNGGHPRDISDIVGAPVTLEDDVWVGFRTTILKGVTVGEKTIIAAGSLVTHDLPPRVLAAGRPATVVRELEED